MAEVSVNSFPSEPLPSMFFLNTLPGKTPVTQSNTYPRKRIIHYYSISRGRVHSGLAHSRNNPMTMKCLAYIALTSRRFQALPQDLDMGAVLQICRLSSNPRGTTVVDWQAAVDRQNTVGVTKLSVSSALTQPTLLSSGGPHVSIEGASHTPSIAGSGRRKHTTPAGWGRTFKGAQDARPSHLWSRVRWKPGRSSSKARY